MWNPFADELLAIWLETMVDGRVTDRGPDGWIDRATELLERYHAFGRRPPLVQPAPQAEAEPRYPPLDVAGASGRPLSTATGDAAACRGLDGEQARCARIGYARALRDAQAQQAARPTHWRLAGIVAERSRPCRRTVGVVDVDDITQPVELGVGGSWKVPVPIAGSSSGHGRAPVEELVTAGVVPSAEVLAQLVRDRGSGCCGALPGCAGADPYGGHVPGLPQPAFATAAQP